MKLVFAVRFIPKLQVYSLHQEQITVFSNYNDGLLKRGKEGVVTNYMELSEDPIG